jgi:hypothetical protein
MPLRKDDSNDLEAALQRAHDHARLYGLWEVAEDLHRVIRGMQVRNSVEKLAELPPSRGKYRRRP